MLILKLHGSGKRHGQFKDDGGFSRQGNSATCLELSRLFPVDEKTMRLILGVAYTKRCFSGLCPGLVINNEVVAKRGLLGTVLEHLEEREKRQVVRERGREHMRKSE